MKILEPEIITMQEAKEELRLILVENNRKKQNSINVLLKKLDSLIRKEIKEGKDRLEYEVRTGSKEDEIMSDIVKKFKQYGYSVEYKRYRMGLSEGELTISWE